MKIGLAAAAIAAVLVIIGIIRGNVPLNPLSILLALLISAGSWGLVAWAIATAARSSRASWNCPALNLPTSRDSPIRDSSVSTTSNATPR